MGAPKDVATSRLREVQLLSQRVGVGSAEGAPDGGYVVNVLGGKGVQARATVGELAVNRGLGAVEASLLSVRRADGDVEGYESGCEHVCRAELRAW